MTQVLTGTATSKSKMELDWPLQDSRDGRSVPDSRKICMMGNHRYSEGVLVVGLHQEKFISKVG